MHDLLKRGWCDDCRVDHTALIARHRKSSWLRSTSMALMTDGTLFLADDGQEYKGFNSLDGHG